LSKEPTQIEIEEFLNELISIRLKYDFEFWCITCVKIKPKLGGEDMPFKLNLPQRILVHELERQRLHDEPIRINLLKSRQWGGSTCTQMYMGWIQLNHKTGWNSVIAAHQKDASATIKGMYAKVLENYPEQLLGKVSFVPFQRMSNCSIITRRNCKVTIGTSEKPDSVRGQDISMAHLSEVAFWKDTPEKKATDVVRSITSSIPLVPFSLIVIESTANGVGDYFYKEWKRSVSGDGDKTPVFIAWFTDSSNQLPLRERDINQFLTSMTLHEWLLWDKGACLEAIKWYRAKRKEYNNIVDMYAEYPSTPTEAFCSTGSRVFDEIHIANISKGECKPIAIGEIFSHTKDYTGDNCLNDLCFTALSTGFLKVWKYPDSDNQRLQKQYVVSVDAGGRSSKSDWSVICVIDRKEMLHGGVPEVVAQWRGHVDLDILAWKSAQIAQFYNEALLVIEANTFESHQTEGEHGEFILETLSQSYSNLYYRTDGAKIREGLPVRYGFHTNKATKTIIINHLIALLRDNGYIEHDSDTVNEYDVYEIKPNGSFGAKVENHDDCLMTRAIGLYVAYDSEPVYEVSKTKMKVRKAIGISSF
ncbi:MAG: hypothetical protein RR383_08550, partial [Muribaculaceae bacterium]